MSLKCFKTWIHKSVTGETIQCIIFTFVREYLLCLSTAQVIFMKMLIIIILTIFYENWAKFQDTSLKFNNLFGILKKIRNKTHNIKPFWLTLVRTICIWIGFELSLMLQASKLSICFSVMWRHVLQLNAIELTYIDSCNITHISM